MRKPQRKKRNPFTPSDAIIAMVAGRTIDAVRHSRVRDAGANRYYDALSKEIEDKYRELVNRLAKKKGGSDGNAPNE